MNHALCNRVEKAGNNYLAYVPDLPGCIATGSTVEETEREIRAAFELHIARMMEDRLPVTQPAGIVQYVEVPA